MNSTRPMPASPSSWGQSLDLPIVSVCGKQPMKELIDFLFLSVFRARNKELIFTTINRSTIRRRTEKLGQESWPDWQHPRKLLIRRTIYQTSIYRFRTAAELTCRWTLPPQSSPFLSSKTPRRHTWAHTPTHELALPLHRDCTSSVVLIKEQFFSGRCLSTFHYFHTTSVLMWQGSAKWVSLCKHKSISNVQSNSWLSKKQELCPMGKHKILKFNYRFLMSILWNDIKNNSIPKKNVVENKSLIFSQCVKLTLKFL